MSYTLLKNLVNFLLFEGKVEDLQAKYPNVDVQDASKNDPSQSNKYLEWMVKQLVSGVRTEDLYPSILYFHRNIQRFENKDINAYKTLKDLEDTIKNLPQKSKTKQRQEAKIEGASKIYENEQLIVVRPDTKEACQIYGSNTKWCITMKDATYYEDYTQNNVVFYFMLFKAPKQQAPSMSSRPQLGVSPYDKIACAIPRDNKNRLGEIEFYDSTDNSLSFQDVRDLKINNFNEVLNSIKNDATKQPPAFIVRVQTGNFTLDEFKTYWKTTDNSGRQYVVELMPDEKLIELQDFIFDNVSPRDTDDILERIAIHTTSLRIQQEFLNPNSKNYSEHLLYYLLKNKNLSKETLDFFFKETVPALLKLRNTRLAEKLIARCLKHPNVPEEYIKKYFNSEIRQASEHINQGILLSPKTPINMLVQIIGEYLQQDPMTHESSLRLFVETTTHSQLIDYILENTSNANVIVAALTNTNISENTLRRLTEIALTQKMQGMLRSVASNSSTPKDVLETIASDDRVVDVIKKLAKDTLIERFGRAEA